ncbi:MAG: hypothetical protein BGO55_04425 [Sphingobacteriales bacterium 50-39]|nr:MAG: hypothetical protein BGO55_04425 [Sphingobacteriales bacterium 50-39]
MGSTNASSTNFAIASSVKVEEPSVPFGEFDFGTWDINNVEIILQAKTIRMAGIIHFFMVINWLNGYMYHYQVRETFTKSQMLF